MYFCSVAFVLTASLFCWCCFEARISETGTRAYAANMISCLPHFYQGNLHTVRAKMVEKMILRLREPSPDQRVPGCEILQSSDQPF